MSNFDFFLKGLSARATLDASGLRRRGSGCSYPYDEGSFVHLWDEVPPTESHDIFGGFQVPVGMAGFVSLHAAAVAGCEKR